MEYYNNGVVSEGSFGESVIENGFAGNNKTKHSSLTPGDFQKFTDSFITREIVEQAGLFRVDSVTGAERIGRTATAHNDYAGIIFPYFLPEDTRPREYRLRRDKPDLEQKNGELKEKGKYLSPPGRGNMFYFPPNCRKEWLEDVSIPIVFTEGEKKELALHRASWHNLSEAAEKPRFIPIGLGGVWNWRGTVGKTNDEGKRRPIKGIIPDFQFVEWQNRKVTILFDANTATNESVQAARSNLARTLTEKGGKVFLADLPEIEGCNGIDDVLGKIESEQNTDDACEFLFDLLKDAYQNEKARESNLKPLQAIRLSDVKSEPVSWLWEQFLALGTFNLLEGEEGIGKTFLTCALSCAVASGKGLPLTSQYNHIEPANVLLISAEDSLSHVLKPRLEAMNAPCEKIIAIDEGFTLDKDGIFRLSMALDEYQPKLVIIDPLFSYTGRISLDRDNEIRSVTDALKRLAEKYDCSIVGIRHIGKSKGFGDARNAGLNGVGWRASARSVLLIGKNPENEFQKALCQTKNNLAPKFNKSLGFEIRDNQFFWTGESDLTAETMLSPIRNENGEEKSEKQDAIAFLREILGTGEKPAKDVQAEARQIGISEATLRRAKTALNVQSRKDSFQNGKWFWYLAEDVQIKAEDTQTNESEHLRVNNTNKTSYSNNLAEDAQTNKLEHLQQENEHLQDKEDDSKCSECTLKLEFSEKDNVWFCPFGCGSQTMNARK
jgi:hypothetical protein